MSPLDASYARTARIVVDRAVAQGRDVLAELATAEMEAGRLTRLQRAIKAEAETRKSTTD